MSLIDSISAMLDFFLESTDRRNPHVFVKHASFSDFYILISAYISKRKAEEIVARMLSQCAKTYT